MTCWEGDADHYPHPTDVEGVDECSGCDTEYVRAEYLDPWQEDLCQQTAEAWRKGLTVTLMMPPHR